MQRWVPRFSLYQLLVFVTLAALAIAWRSALWEVLTNSVPAAVALGIVALLYCATWGIRASLARWGTLPCWRLDLLGPLCFLAARWRVAYQFALRGVEAITAGNQQRAIELLTEAIRLEPTSANYWTNRGIAHYCLGKHEAAIADLTHGLQLDPAENQARVYRGYAYFALGEHQLALDDLSHYPCVAREDAEAAYYRGLARQEVFAWERAAEDFALAYRLDDSLHTAAMMLARLQACCPLPMVRNGPKALANAKRICALEGWDNWHCLSILAAAYAECGDFATAMQYAQQAHNLAPDEEKPERQRRIEQFQRNECYRLPQWEAKCQST